MKNMKELTGREDPLANMSHTTLPTFERLSFMSSTTINQGKVIALHPFRRAQTFDQHYELGRMFREQGRLDDATRELQRAAALDRTHVDVRLDLGVLLAEKGQLHQAIALFKQVKKSNPSG